MIPATATRRPVLQPTQRPRNDHSRGSAELATHSDFLMSAETQEPGTMISTGPAVGRFSEVPIPAESKCNKVREQIYGNSVN